MIDVLDQPWLKVHDELGMQVPDYEDRPLADYLAEHASERGDNVALRFHDRGITYAEFDRYASQLANALKDLGVKKGDVVGIHMPNVPQYPIALAAISRLGAVGSGVSPLLTPPEMEYQIQNASIRVMLSLDLLAPLYGAIGSAPNCLQAVIITGGADLLAPGEITLPEIDGVKVLSWLDAVNGQSEQCEQIPVHWNDPFMIQYTGGTTGPPKGAELSVRSIMHNPAQYLTALEYVVGSEVTASAFPMFHIAGLTAAISGTIIAAEMILLPDPRNVEFFCRQMQKFRPTILSAVPALYDMLLGCPLFREIDFSSVKLANSGAAPLPRATYEAVAGVLGEGKLTDIFGMTETGPCYTTHPPGRYKAGSVGFPVPGANVRIMDVETGTQQMPVGEAGEIICSGPQVMKGYLNLPDETANALRDIDGETWMFGGDVGYMDEEGYLFLCDRAKDMLIVGGFKVFSVEVEDKLKSVPCIAASAVIGVPDEERRGNDIVTLYVQLVPESAGDEPDTLREQILQYCQEQLAPYKVPKQIHFIEQIPLTAVGKIDKKQLREEAQSGA